MRNKKFVLREGFWYSEYEPHLPKPIANEKGWKGKRQFLEAFAEIQSKAQERHYRGWSTCRCCGERNGTSDFTLSEFDITWNWPAGYAHYVVVHNVRPSLAFQEFVLTAAQITPEDKS